MGKDIRLIDSNAHVLETNDLFEKYLEPKFRRWIPEACAKYAGNPLGFGCKIVIETPNGDKQMMPFGTDPMSEEARALCGGAGFDPGARVALPGHDEGYAEFAREDFPPRMYPLVMDRAGIDYMVVYPSVGLLSTARLNSLRRGTCRQSCMAVLSCGVQNHSAALENDSFEPLKRSAETQPVA